MLRCNTTNVRTCDIRTVRVQTQVFLQNGELKPKLPTTRSHHVLFNWSIEGMAFYNSSECLGWRYHSVVRCSKLVYKHH